MSWGERSCVNFGRCNRQATIRTCNTWCLGYERNPKVPVGDPRPSPKAKEGNGGPNDDV